jgi:hypothetical protein
MGGTSSKNSNELGDVYMKYCHPQKSDGSIPDNNLKKVKYRYPTFNCGNATTGSTTASLCADENFLSDIYSQKIKDYFKQLDECLRDNQFNMFMKYYNIIKDILNSNDNDYTYNEAGVIKLKNDIKKVNKYVLEKLGTINDEMAKSTTGEIGPLNNAVNNINQTLDLSSQEYSDSYKYKFNDGINDTKLNELKFFTKDNTTIMSDIFFDRIINFYSLIYILNKYPRIERTLNLYEKPELLIKKKINVLSMSSNNSYMYKGGSSSSNWNNSITSLISNHTKAQATNTIKELLGESTDNSHKFNIKQTIDKINEITRFIGYFRNSGPDLFNNGSINVKSVLNEYINRIQYISNKTFVTWTSFNRNSINHDIKSFKELVKLLFDNSYQNSLIFKIINKIRTKIDDHFDQLGENFKTENINKLIGIKDRYIRINKIAEKLVQMRVFNQTYKFKCQKFGNKVHVVLSYNNQNYENYLLNPNDTSKGTPTIYDEDIGPICIKDSNPNNIESRNICFDYEVMDACEAHLLQPGRVYSDSSFRKSPIDDKYVEPLTTANNQITYSMQGKLFNDKSNLHDTDFSNLSQINIDKLDTAPDIKERVTTTTTIPTTTQYIHTDVDSQPTTTTRQPDPNIPDDVIPDGVYYFSIVEDTVEKYLNLYKNTENNNFFIQRKDLTPDNKNNSIVVVKNIVLNAFRNNPQPVKFITINYTDTVGQKYYLQINTDTHNDKIIIVEQRDTSYYPLTDNNYFLPVEHETPTISSNPIYSVNLKSALPSENNTDTYCNNINEIAGNINLTQIESDSSINNIIHNLLNIRNDNNLPVIGCSFDDPNTYFKLEFKESI